MFIHRPRRNRKSAAIRSLVQEVHIHPSDLIYPQFVIDGSNQCIPIPSMPGIYRLSVDKLLEETEKCMQLGVYATILFPVIPEDKKNEKGTEAVNAQGILPQAIRALKKEFPELCVMSDVALDPYTSHGHDGIINNQREIDNDKTVSILTQMAVIHAEAGTDMVAPSDMMDGRVEAIRNALDTAEFFNVSVHAYSAKYASAFYGPFRDALSSRPKFGNKKSYQLNPANQREALLEALLDEKEGADILMIKPALPYLDIISKIREATTLPISAFQVSGEYAMIKASSQNGWIDEKMAFYESIIGIKRAGADMIFTYAAPQIAQWLTTDVLY